MTKPISNSIAVAAVSTSNPGLKYKGVDTGSKTTIFRETVDTGTTDIGNFLAIVHALLLLKRNGLEVGALYTSSEEAIRWLNNKKCTFPLPKSKKNQKLAEAISQAEKWLAENEVKTKILKWNKKEWGAIENVVLPSSR